MKPLINLLLLFSIVCTISCSAPVQQKEAATDQVENPTSVHEPIPKPPPVLDRQLAGELDETKTSKPKDYASEEESWEMEEGSEEALEESDWGEAQPEAEIEEKTRSAKLAFYCPGEMTYKQTSDVIGFIAELIDESLIVEMMEGRLENQAEDHDVDINREAMLIHKLQLYNHIELRLDDADNEGFTIKKIHEANIQEVIENMEGWHWKVTPTSTDATQQLVLKVIVYKNDMSRVTSFDKTYFVDVKIESKLFIRNTYALFVENPEWAFASVIAPIITFLIGRFNRRRKEKKKKKKSSA